MAGRGGRQGVFSLEEKHLIEEDNSLSSMASPTSEEKIVSLSAGSAAEPRKNSDESSTNEGTNGCVVCNADDDHANLLICENCDAEYHTYCLEPPLRSVPENDFYCDSCKHLTMFPSFDLDELEDGLDAMVNALPPKFTSRFGEIVWAAGGVGFGWWPAYIYDPRLTVGGARQLAKRNLGKKHLVYFFECHDAPFTVLGNSKLTPWQDGLQEEYDLGKTAKANSKNRSLNFDKALQCAMVEYEKPLDMRLEWNHPKPGHNHGHKRKSANITSDSSKKKQRNVNVGGPTQKVEELESNKKKTKKTSDAPSSTSNNAPTRWGISRRSNRAIKISHFADYVDASEETRALNIALKLSAAEAASNSAQTQETQHKSIVGAVPPTETASSPVYEDVIGTDADTLFCQIFVKDNDDVAIGFISLKSRWNSTFSEARSVMEVELDDDGTLPSVWKFYAPLLGPISRKQEGKLKILDFLCTPKQREGVGTRMDPIKIILQPFPGKSNEVAKLDIGTQTDSIKDESSSPTRQMPNI